MSKRILEKLRRYCITGIATLLPLVITIYIIIAILRLSNQIAGKYINAFLLEKLGYEIPGLGFIFLIFIVVIVGFLVNIFLVKKVFQFFENIFAKIPFISNVYPSAKKLTNFLFDSGIKKKFKKVVLVEYPHKENYCIGFVTSKGFEELHDKTEKELISVLVPLAPAPFSGLLMYIPEEKVKALDITIDQAIKLIVSGGVVLPTKNE
jgi:uncharacterized membrane protein